MSGRDVKWSDGSVVGDYLSNSQFYLPRTIYPSKCPRARWFTRNIVDSKRLSDQARDPHPLLTLAWP